MNYETATLRREDGETAVADHDEDAPRSGHVPIIRSREEHCITRRNIDPDALKVIYRLSKNNFTAYLVGGGVRDLLLCRKPKDFDISTDARPEQIKSLFRNCLLIGRRFRLAHVRYGDKIIETSTFRRAPELNADPNDPEADLFQRDDNLFGSPEEDALRRDFTVNGLFYDLESFSVIDYVGGMEDLALKRIRAIGDPGIRFREDPVRMLRAVRFASRLDFAIEEETLAAIIRHRDELPKASPARLLEEITRLFAFSSGEKAMRLFHSTGLLRAVLPELADFLDEMEGTEAFWKRLATLDQGDTVLPEATQALIFATLCVDPLRLAASRDEAGTGSPRHNFEVVRSFVAKIAERLHFPRKLVERVNRVLLAQTRFSGHGRRRFSPESFASQDWFQEALALMEINATTDGGRQEALNKWRSLLAERLFTQDDGNRQRNGNRNQNRHPVGPPRHLSTDTVVMPRRTEEDGGDESAAASAPVPGQGISRSARRRRNRQRNRERREMEKKKALELESGKADAPAVEKQPDAAKAPAPAASDTGETPETKQPDKKINSRGRRKKTEKSAAGSEAKATPKELPAETADHNAEEPQKPLTAAAFYGKPEPEQPAKPEKKAKTTSPKKNVKEGKTLRDKTEAAKDEKSPGRKTKKSSTATDKAKPEKTEAAHHVDRSEEAEIPLHWLDEI